MPADRPAREYPTGGPALNKQENERLAEEPQEEAQPETQGKRFSERVMGGGAVREDQLDRKKLMKRFRRAKNLPSAEDVERFTPDPDKGLTSEQAELRFSQFLFNDVSKSIPNPTRASSWGISARSSTCCA